MYVLHCIALHRQRRIVGYSIRRQETEPTHRLAWTFRHDYQRGKLITIQQNVMFIKLTTRKVMTMFRWVITKSIHTNIHSYIVLPLTLAIVITHLYVCSLGDF